MSQNFITKGISKPKKKTLINTTKSSDRRLATARQPANFLHNSVNNLQQLQQLGHHNKIESLKISNQSSTPKDLGNGKLKTVKRVGGGKSWEDSSLLEWDPNHFRLFVGNLGKDVNDDLLIRYFGKYGTLSKVKVPIDPKSGENKGYGFVAFESSSDYLQAFKEMNGKYIGQHPCQLKRAQTDIKPTVVKKKYSKSNKR